MNSVEMTEHSNNEENTKSTAKRHLSRASTIIREKTSKRFGRYVSWTELLTVAAVIFTLCLAYFMYWALVLDTTTYITSEWTAGIKCTPMSTSRSVSTNTDLNVTEGDLDASTTAVLTLVPHPLGSNAEGKDGEENDVFEIQSAKTCVKDLESRRFTITSESDPFELIDKHCYTYIEETTNKSYAVVSISAQLVYESRVDGEQDLRLTVAGTFQAAFYSPCLILSEARLSAYTYYNGTGDTFISIKWTFPEELEQSTEYDVTLPDSFPNFDIRNDKAKNLCRQMHSDSNPFLCTKEVHSQSVLAMLMLLFNFSFAMSKILIDFEAFGNVARLLGCSASTDPDATASDLNLESGGSEDSMLGDSSVIMSDEM